MPEKQFAQNKGSKNAQYQKQVDTKSTLSAPKEVAK